MKVLMWKKRIELKKQPIKLLLFLSLPCALFFMFYIIFNIKLEYIFRILPLISCCFSTIMVFNVEDITYISWYKLLGINIKTVWIQNILFILVYQYIAAEITLVIVYLTCQVDITLYTIYVNLTMSVIATCLIGLSTIHFSSNSKRTVIVASVFAIVNLVSPVFVYLLNDTPRFKGVCVVVLVSLVIDIIMYKYMDKNRGEQLINNTQIYIGGYNDKFFGED